MQTAFRARVRASPILGTSDLGQLFENISNASREELINELNRVLLQKSSDGDYQLPDSVVRFIAMQIVGIARSPSNKRSLPRSDHERNPASFLRNQFVQQYAAGEHQALTTRIRAAEWVDDLRQSQGFQAHFDQTLLEIINVGGESGFNAPGTDAMYAEDGLALYTEIVSGIRQSMVDADFPRNALIPLDIVKRSLDAFADAHGYVSVLQLLTYYRVNEAFRLAVLEYAKSITAIGFGDLDDALVSGLTDEQKTELQTILGRRIRSVHMLTNSPPQRLAKLLIGRASSIYMYDENTIPMNFIKTDTLKFLYWMINMTLVGDIPMVQQNYFELLANTYPAFFGRTNKKKGIVRHLSVQLVYADFTGDSETLLKSEPVVYIRVRSLACIINTTRGYIRAVEPGIRVAAKNANVIALIQNNSRDFYATANFNDLMIKNYTFLAPRESTGEYIEPEESESSSISDSDSSAEEDGDAMQTGRRISLEDARNQLRVLFAHLDLPLPASLQGMSRAGLIIFINNLLSVPESETSTAVSVPELRQLMRDLNTRIDADKPYAILDKELLDNADRVQTDNERLKYYSSLTLDEIDRIFTRYENIGKTGGTAAPHSVNPANAESFLQTDIDPMFDFESGIPTLPASVTAYNPAFDDFDFGMSMVSASHQLSDAMDIDVPDEEEEEEEDDDKDDEVERPISDVQRGIEATVLQLIDRNAAYTQQGFPDLLKLIRIIRLSPLFFDVAIRKYLPSITSLVIRGDFPMADKTAEGVNNKSLRIALDAFTEDELTRFFGALGNVVRIMGLYGDAKDPRLRPLFAQIYEYRAAGYGNSVYPHMELLFSTTSELPNLRLLVLQQHVTMNIRNLFMENPRESAKGVNVSDQMKRLLPQLSLIIEQYASTHLVRPNEVEDRMYGKKGAKKAEPALLPVLRGISAHLGGVCQVRPGTGRPVLFWPSDPEIDDAAKRNRTRRTLVDIAVLHDLVNTASMSRFTGGAHILFGGYASLEERADAIRQELIRVAVPSKFLRTVTTQRFNAHSYPDPPSNTLGLEFQTRDAFLAYHAAIEITMAMDPLIQNWYATTDETDPVRAKWNRWKQREATNSNFLAVEVVYASIIFYIKDRMDFFVAGVHGMVPFGPMLELCADNSPLGHVARYYFARRIPSISIGKAFSTTTGLDVKYDTFRYIVDHDFVNVTSIVARSSLDHPVVQPLMQRANTVSIIAREFPISRFTRLFNPMTLRDLSIDLPASRRHVMENINDITLLFVETGQVQTLAEKLDISLSSFSPTLLRLDFTTILSTIDPRDLEEHIATLPFVISQNPTVIANQEHLPPYNAFREGQKKFIRDVWSGTLVSQFGSEVERTFVGFPSVVVPSIPASPMQRLGVPAKSPRAATFTVRLSEIVAKLIGEDREYGPILYAWTSWGTGRRAIRIAATDDDATTLMSTWEMSLPPIDIDNPPGDARIYFSLYARSRESGLDSINATEAAVIDRIIPVGRASVSLRQLLVDTLAKANRASRTFHFEEPTLNAKLEQDLLQQLGVTATADQRNSIRDRVMRENASGSFRVGLVLTVHQLGIIAPLMITAMERDVERRFRNYTSDTKRIIVPPFEEELLESIYLRAMSPLFLRYVDMFIGDDETPPRIRPSSEAASTLHLFLWQTPIAALVPARAFWQNIPQLIPYSSKEAQRRDIAMFEDSSRAYKEVYFEDLLQLSLDVDDLSPDFFLAVVKAQLADRTGSRVHDWFLTCAAACFRFAMLAANAVHYTSDFRFSRDGKAHEDEYWNIDLSTGLGNAGDCENSEQLATTLIRTVFVDRDKWQSELLLTAARVIELYLVMDIGAVVTAAYVGEDTPSNTGELPIVGSKADMASETGGHCHGLATSKAIAVGQMTNGGASTQQIRDAFAGKVTFSPWQYRLHGMVVEGTGAIFPYILPLKETFADHPIEYAFHAKKRDLATRVINRMAVDHSVGFGTYRYPFYDTKPKENRRISSFYRLFCHGILATEAMGAPELGKLTFAKPAGSRKLVWGVSAGEYLRDGRGGPGTSRMALVSSCLDMREHFTRYVNPYIESVVGQLPFAGVGRELIAAWSDLDADSTKNRVTPPSIRTHLECSICPRCEIADDDKPRASPLTEKIIANHAIKEYKETARIRATLGDLQLMPIEKVSAVLDVILRMKERGEMNRVAEHFSIRTLWHYALASEAIADVLLQNDVWEMAAIAVLGEDLYADTIQMRDDSARAYPILEGTPMYFLIIATYIVHRNAVVQSSPFRVASVTAITPEQTTSEVETSDSDIYDTDDAVELARLLSLAGFDMDTRQLPLIGGSTVYFKSLVDMGVAITDGTSKQYLDSIEAYLMVGFPGDPIKPKVKIGSNAEISNTWMRVMANMLWRTKIRPLIAQGIATPRGLLALPYQKIMALPFPAAGKIGPHTTIRTDADIPPGYAISDMMDVYRAMSLDDAYKHAINEWVAATPYDDTAIPTTHIKLMIGSAAELYSDSADERAAIAKRIADTGPTPMDVYFEIAPLVYSNRIYPDEDALMNMTTRFITSNWGFYPVSVSIRSTLKKVMVIITELLPHVYDPRLYDKNGEFHHDAWSQTMLGECMSPVSVYQRRSYKEKYSPLVLTQSAKSLNVQVAPVLPSPLRLSFFAYGWILKSPEHLATLRERADTITNGNAVFDVFTPLPSTGDMNLRIVMDFRK